MRTSPPHVRRGFPRRALAVGLVAALACTDDGGDDTTPTTTSPSTSDGASTTTEAGGSTTTAPDGSGGSVEPDGGSTAPGSPALTSPEAQRVITQLMGNYQSALAQAKAAEANEEGLLVGLSNVYLGGTARDQVTGLISFGGLGSVRPDPQRPEVGAVDVVGGDASCVSGTVRVLLDPMFTRSLGARQPHSFRLEPAPDGAPDPAWRLSYLSFSSESAYTEEATCAA